MRGIRLSVVLLLCAITLQAQNFSEAVNSGEVALIKTAVENTVSHKNAEQDLQEIPVKTPTPVSNSFSYQLKRIIKDDIAIPLTDIRFQGIAMNTMLGQTPGFSLKSNGDLATRAIYASRGLDQHQVRFFIDGVPLEYFGSDYSVNATLVSLMDRFEMHNKVNPIFLLTDKQGGAINFRTKEDIGDRMDVSYSYGSFNTHQVSATGYSRDKLSGITFRGVTFVNYSDNNYKVWEGDVSYEVSDDTQESRREKVDRFNDAYFNVGAKMDLGFTGKSWADQLFLSTWYAKKYDEVQHGATMKVPFGERYYRQETMMPSLTYQKSNFIWKGFDVHFFTGYAAQHRDVKDVSNYRYNWLGERFTDSSQGEQSAALSYSDDDTAISRIALDYKYKKNHTWTLSNAYTNLKRTYDNIKAPVEDRTSGEEQRLKKNIIGLAYTNTSNDHKLNTSFFGKYYNYGVHMRETAYDREEDIYIPTSYNNNENHYGYGVVVKYDFNPRLMFQSSFERAVTMPEADQLFGNETENVISTVRTDLIDELKPEESKNTYLSVIYNNDPRDDHRFNIGAHITLRNVKNYMQADVLTVNNADYFFFENHQKILSKEFELQVDYRYLEILDASFSTSFLDARNNSSSTKEGDDNFYFNSRLKNEPYFEMNGAVSFRTFYDVFQQDPQFTFSWNIRYVHEFLRTWELVDEEATETIPSQFVNNLEVVYGFPNKKVYMHLEARNIFDERVFDKYAIQHPGRGVYFKLAMKL